MTAIKKNIIANYAGTGLQFALGIFFTGLYFNLLGASNYGVIGIVQSLQMLMQVSDIGLTASINREMARADLDCNYSPSVVLRTLGLVNLGIALSLSVLLIATMPSLIEYSINIKEIDLASTINCLRWLVVMLSSQTIASFYTAALMGLQRQPLANGINSILQTTRHLATWCALVFISPSIYNFFITQSIFTVINAVALASVAYSAVGKHKSRAWFKLGVVQKSWRFGLACAGTTVIGLIISQIDRFFLVKHLSLSDFGVYSLSSNIAAIVYRILSPMVGAYYPQFTQLAFTGSEGKLFELYTRVCTHAGSIIIPISLCFVTLPDSILIVFRGLAIITESERSVMIVLAIGATLGACSCIPHSIQQAHGNQRFGLQLNFVSIFVYLPGLWFCIQKWGVIGAAFTTLFLHLINCICFPIYTAVLYFERRYVKYYLRVLILPLIFAFVPFAVANYVPWRPTSKIGCGVFCAVVTSLAYIFILLGYKVFCREDLLGLKNIGNKLTNLFK